MKSRELTSPAGTADLSPALQRWESCKNEPECRRHGRCTLRSSTRGPLLHLLLQLMQQIQRLQRADGIQVSILDAVHDLLRERGEDGQLHGAGSFGFVLGEMRHRVALSRL